MTEYFVDTNVVVYSRDATDATKHARALMWMDHLWKEQCGAISYQVLQEYYVTVTQKLKPGLAKSAARQDVSALLAWRPITIDEPVLKTAWSVQDEFGFSWWDSLIVAAAKFAGCDYLLTEDLQHEQDLGGIKTLNPFLSEPPAKSGL